jgi:hypothetical protein
MNQKTIEDYGPEHTERVISTCLHIATVLGDLIDDLVVIGGIVPTLLIDQSGDNPEIEAHAGSMDLDLGFQLVLLEESKYHAISERLREADFKNDINESGNPTVHRWRWSEDESILIDFLIPPVDPNDRGGSIRHLEGDFGAIVIPGLPLAFEDRIQVTLSGKTLLEESAIRNIWVCGPGSFIILKALALRNRGKVKDAYDIYYFLKNYGDSIDDICRGFDQFLDEPLAKEALEILKENFTDPEAIGPVRAALFISTEPDTNIQADAAGFGRSLLSGVSKLRSQ